MKHRLKSFSQTNTINKANTILLDLEKCLWFKQI